jgi:triosephosphate isomerase
MRPLFVVNFKTYEQSTGENAVKLAKAIEKAASKKKGVETIIAVQPTDLWQVSKSVNIPVFAQHLDPVEPGAHTGWILPQALKAAGAAGTLLNHSERRLDLASLEKSIAAARAQGLRVIACADTPETAASVARLKPDCLAIEPPELIGGDVSVSTARPGIITDTLSVAGGTPVLVGAGIKTAEDVSIGRRLGAAGILVASGIVKAADPAKAALDMLGGFG